MRYAAFIALLALSLIFLLGGIVGSRLWFIALAVTGPLAAIGVWDVVQTRHSILRNYPVLAHMRFLFEDIRPEMQQYFIERNWDGRPYDRDSRSLIYERAKNTHEEQPFGTELDVYEPGYEWFAHSMAPKPKREEQFRVSVGGPACKQPYSMSLFNVSAMSFGALSCNAIRALNKGARLGDFAHDTGEGGLTAYHLENGGDLIWEIGTAYFGCRTRDGKFDAVKFHEKANHPNVKCVSIKLSQGAKPGLGGVMPAAKVTPEIAEIRGVPVHEKCVSPPYHTAFKTPRGLIEFVDQLRQSTGGKPTGFKLCIGRQSEFLGVCKAMLDMQVFPDFIIVDGGEGGTGAAPLEFENHVGAPLDQGLMFVHNALVGCGLRDKIRIGCSGKIASGFAIAKRLTQGADYCNAARAMMMAVGCIQAQKCQTNKCPVGVATQDPQRYRALHVPDKAQRVFHFHRNTVLSFNELLAALGLDAPGQLDPSLLHRRVTPTEVRTYCDLFPHLQPAQLVAGQTPLEWSAAWQRANADVFC